ncbi:YciI family protein [Prauserella flavalba]|uniref:YciI family protein n=1 Tax=Prauserella flavalba TaxID=1477506 RepID=UPI0036ED6965
MKQYLLSIYQPTGGVPAPDVLAGVMRDLERLNRELRAAGAWVFAGGLHSPESATVLRPDGDHVLTTDGPFAEGKEHLGGFTIIKAGDLDSALHWGRRLAKATTLPVEVRPFQDEAGD